jgi:glycosyltransferase involved in cell wall biosynthesis
MNHDQWSLSPGDAVRTHRRPSKDGRPLKLSILMPVYNEERTIRRAIETVLAQEYPVDIELCVIEDGSTDSTHWILGQIHDPRMIVRRHPTNLGKGAALLSAAVLASGTHIVPFDADLEYSARDLPRMLAPIIEDRCDVVFGTRMFGMYTSYQSYSQALGNRALTRATNMLFNCYLSDVHTCLKMMPLELFLSLDLREPRFGLDAEVVARILQLGIRPFEVPVSYHSRSVADGKKITWRDGFHCLRVLGRVRREHPGSTASKVRPPAPVVGSTAPIHAVADAHAADRRTATDVVNARPT